MSIKYYRLAKGEELPDEFCVVRDVNGEPGEYTFYVPEAESAKVRSGAMSEPTCYYYDSERNRCNCYNADLTRLARANELEAENAKLRGLLDSRRLKAVMQEDENEALIALVLDLLNAWDDMQNEVVTGPTFDECKRRAYELGIEVQE